MLAALEPTTTVTTDSDVTVADRAAYELVLDPNDDDSLIGQVRLAIDGETKMPLRVQVFNVNAAPVFEVGYDSVSFTRPEDREFEFKAAAGDQGDRGRAGHAADAEQEGARAGCARRPEEARELRQGRRAPAGAPWWSQRPGADRRQRAGASCRASSASCRRSAAPGARAGCWPGPPSPRC